MKSLQKLMGMLVIALGLLCGFVSEGFSADTTKYSFILIHGSWQDGSAWAMVKEKLEGQGHSVYAPTLLGNGIGVNKKVTLEETVDALAEDIVKNDRRNFVLVGHSFGGSIIGQIADRMPDRVRRLVFFDAFVPVNGQSLSDDFPPANRDLFRSLAAKSEDGSIPLDWTWWREMLIGDADLETAKAAYATLSPEPYGRFEEKVTLKSSIAQSSVPKSYILGLDDNSNPWHPKYTDRLGVYRLVSMPGSHELMFSNPEGLAKSIIAAGRD